MKTIMVRYRTKAAYADTNVTRVQAVFEELRASQAKGVRYACHRLDDGVSFVHVASVADGVDNPIPKLAAFKQFQAGLRENLEEPPVTTEASVVEAYDGGS